MNPASSSEPRLKLRERLRGATRDAILEAAAEVFSAGATQARMEDIAARAGVAVGTVYNYFEDRTALVNALLEGRRRDMFDALDRAVSPSLTKVTGRSREKTTVSFEAELERFVAPLASHFDANRSLLSVLLDEELNRGIDAAAASHRHTIQHEVLERAERLMAKGIRSHALQKGNPTVYAAMLVGMVRGVATSALAHPDARFADSAREIVRVFLKGASR
jgi:AcrR family transcriptional regulator